MREGQGARREMNIWRCFWRLGLRPGRRLRTPFLLVRAPAAACRCEKWALMFVLVYAMDGILTGLHLTNYILHAQRHATIIHGFLSLKRI